LLWFQFLDVALDLALFTSGEDPFYFNYVGGTEAVIAPRKKYVMILVYLLAYTSIRC